MKLKVDPDSWWTTSASCLSSGMLPHYPNAGSAPVLRRTCFLFSSRYWKLLAGWSQGRAIAGCGDFSASANTAETQFQLTISYCGTGNKRAIQSLWKLARFPCNDFPSWNHFLCFHHRNEFKGKWVIAGLLGITGPPQVSAFLRESINFHFQGFQM